MPSDDNIPQPQLIVGTMTCVLLSMTYSAPLAFACLSKCVIALAGTSIHAGSQSPVLG